MTNSIDCESTTEAPACPSWCEEPAGHDWPIVDTFEPDRGHYRQGDRYSGSGQLWIAAYGEGDVANHGNFEPRIQLDMVNGLTAAEARDLASELLRLAALIDPKSPYSVALPVPHWATEVELPARFWADKADPDHASINGPIDVTADLDKRCFNLKVGQPEISVKYVDGFPDKSPDCNFTLEEARRVVAGNITRNTLTDAVLPTIRAALGECLDVYDNPTRTDGTEASHV